MNAVLTVWGSVALIVIGTLLLFLSEMDNPKTFGPLDWGTKGLAALFASVSARTVVGIKRRHEDFVYAKPDTEVKPGDHLIVAGPTRMVERFAALY
jgi:trk system potassium uptake protein TrkA